MDCSYSGWVEVDFLRVETCLPYSLFLVTLPGNYLAKLKLKLTLIQKCIDIYWQITCIVLSELAGSKKNWHKTKLLQTLVASCLGAFSPMSRSLFSNEIGRTFLGHGMWHDFCQIY
jgi:hypothetical protein